MNSFFTALVDTSDELKQQGFLDLLVAVDSREEGLSHISVLLWVFFNSFDLFEL